MSIRARDEMWVLMGFFIVMLLGSTCTAIALWPDSVLAALAILLMRLVLGMAGIALFILGFFGIIFTWRGEE